jgi:hypothetical protein
MFFIFGYKNIYLTEDCKNSCDLPVAVQEMSVFPFFATLRITASENL